MLSEGIYYNADPAMLQGIGWMEALVKRDMKAVAVDAGELVYFRDGIGGFTTVREFTGIDGKVDYFVYSSGKVDASTLKIDMVTQTLLAHFPLLFHPNPKRVLVLGLASGITAGETLHYPVEQLDVLEINQEMAGASDFFRRWNNNVVSDPRTRIIVQDARAHMQLTRRTYDVIISEPSNPWMAGLANLFTREYFELNKDRLNDNGIFIQWVHSYQMDWNTFSLIGRTFQTVFPSGKLIRTSDSALDLMLVGFKGDGILDIRTAERNMQYAMKSRAMTLSNPYLFYDLILSEDLGGLFGRGPVNTDNRPLLEFSAPKIIYRHKEFSSAGYQEILVHLKKDRWLKPETNHIIQAVNSDFEAQIDRIKFYLPHATPINLSTAAPEQISRYAAVLGSFCANNLVENFHFVDDPDLLSMCIATQIQTMEEKLGAAENPYGLLTHLAHLYTLSKLPRKAIQYYVQAIRTDPTKDKAYFNLGNLYSQQGLIDEAFEMYRKAIQIDPRNAEVFYNLGLLLARQKKLAEAEVNLRRSLSLDPELIPSHFVLGNVLKDMGKTDEGNHHLEEAARLERAQK
ncbi:MAG: spermidine synthase [Candidatus Latescibacterota bacterium]